MKKYWRDTVDIKELKKRRLRVILINDSYEPVVDGVVRVMENYAREFQKQDVEFLILAPKYKRYDVANDDKLEFKPLRLRTATIKWGGYEVFQTPLNIFQLKDIDAFNPDIIHVHCPFFSGKVALQLKKRYNIPIVCTFHTDFKQAIYNSCKLQWVADLSVKIMNEFFYKCDEVWTVSQIASNWLRHDYKLKKSVRVIPNGTAFAYPDNADLLRNKAISHFNIDTTKKNLLFVSRFVWEKNIKLLLDSYKALIESDDSYSLTMVGGDWKAKEIIKYANRIGILEKIKFTGVVKDPDILKGLYLSHDLFVFLSTFDTFGLVTREAEALKCPVLAVENTASAEGIIDTINGFTVKENINDIVHKITDIFNYHYPFNAIKQEATKIPISWSWVAKTSIKHYYRIIEKYYANQKKKDKYYEREAIKGFKSPWWVYKNSPKE
ncbi:glycosyltransferase [Mycoplasmopsis felifaucium]|uniref:Glycosyltransferase n=1 Tax=Mycoplasmopsis felifaucium TaxID=35768 RepID=A0ABZ2RRP4_9BACT